jgi:hypothetical protein
MSWSHSPTNCTAAGSALDAGSAREKVSRSYVQLKKVRNEVDVRHTRWFDEAESLTGSVGTLPEKPRTVERQRHRPNTPADSASDYYRRVVTIPFLDHLKSQIQTRFSQNNLDVMDAVYGLPQNVPMYSDWQTKLFLYLLFLNFWRFTRMICHNLAFWIQNWKCGVNVVKWRRVLYLRNLPMFYPSLIK